MMSIGRVVIARCRFDAVGECEEMVIWSAEGRRDELEGAMMTNLNVDCIYADERI